MCLVTTRISCRLRFMIHRRLPVAGAEIDDALGIEDDGADVWVATRDAVDAANTATAP